MISAAPVAVGRETVSISGISDLTLGDRDSRDCPQRSEILQKPRILPTNTVDIQLQ
jgi:hypothetical protein